MSDAEDVLCKCENGAVVKRRDVDRTLEFDHCCYLILRKLHKTLFGSILLAVEQYSGKFVVLKQTVVAVYQENPTLLEDPWVKMICQC